VSRDEAVKAAAEALAHRIRARATYCMSEPAAWRGTGHWEGLQDAAELVEEHAAAAAVTAAWPHIEAAVRAQIAAEIDQEWAVAKDRERNDGGYRDGYLDGLEHAERIADPKETR